MSAVEQAMGAEKPLQLRAIFILNALKILLTIGFYIAFEFTGFTVGGMTSSMMLYTLIGYVAAFAAMVFCILKRNLLGLRISILIDFLISVPAKAFIGFAIAVIGIALTFTAPVKAYFHRK